MSKVAKPMESLKTSKPHPVTILGVKELILPDKDFDALLLLPVEPIIQSEDFLTRVREFVKANQVSLFTPIFTYMNQLVMAYVAPDLEIIQPACFWSDPTCPSAELGTDVTVFAAPWGKTALCVGGDVFQPQYARTAALKGCQIMINCLWQDDESWLMAGPWSMAQGNSIALYVSGQSGGQWVAPCQLTRDNSGFGLEAIDLEELVRSYSLFPVFDSLNRDFYRQYREELLR